MFLNTIGVQLDEGLGLVADPDLEKWS